MMDEETSYGTSAVAVATLALRELVRTTDGPLMQDEGAAELLRVMAEATRLITAGHDPFQQLLPAVLVVRALQWLDVADVARFEAVSRGSSAAVATMVQRDWALENPHSSAVPPRRCRLRCVLLPVQESWASLHRFAEARKKQVCLRSVTALSGWDLEHEDDTLGGAINFTIKLSSSAEEGQQRLYLGSFSDGAEERPNALLSALGALRSGPVVVSVVAGSGHVAFLTADGKVLTAGDGGRGQCGHGDAENVLVPKEIAALSDRRIVSIAAGSRHTSCVTDAGALFCFGFGGNHRLGHGSTDNALLPLEVEALRGKHVVLPCCGWNHAAAVTRDGRLYVWGDGSRGQIGNGACEPAALPQLVASLASVHVSAVSCGGLHTVAVSDAGSVWTWGNGDSGRLGHGNEQNVLTPKLVDALANCRVVCVSAGLYCTMASTAAGHLYSWGYGGDGALGHGDEQSQLEPRRVEGLGSIAAVTSGWHHSAALTDGGELLASGDAGSGRTQLRFQRAHLMMSAADGAAASSGDDGAMHMSQ